MERQPKYKIYATLLDAFTDYLRSSEIYQEYWGFAENPEKTEEEFEQAQLQALLDRINRVPFDSEAADKGTAFNEVVDCLILGRKSDKMEIASIPEVGIIAAEYNNRKFGFSIALCREFASYYKGAIPQVRVEAILPTQYGDALVYGVIDELMPLSVHDVKTTSKYAVGKYAHHWQHIVYPYCLHENGNHITDFEYNVVRFGTNCYATYTEHYAYRHERDKARLTAHVEAFIEFLEANRSLITDKKIFAEE